MKKKMSIVLIISMLISMAIPGSIFAEASKSTVKESTAINGNAVIDEIAESIGDAENIPFDYTRESDRKKALKLAADLPDKYDLRNVDGISYVTPVKQQSPFENCWGFAAIAAAEMSILGDSKLRESYTADIRKEAEDSGKVQMDLSEKQLTYFTRTPINDPKSPQNGEGDAPIILDPDEDPVAAAYNLGGFAPTATSMFAAGVGPVLESEDPLFEYKGKEGTIQKEWIGDTFQKYEYSDQDDWTLDESMRFSHSFSLGESYVLPSPATIEETALDDTYEFNPAGVAAIKEQLYQKRGVQIGYKHDTFNQAYEDHGEYINSNYAHYTYTPEGAQHAVCIVGWDDTYPKENFEHEVEPNDDGITKEDTVPPGDGAWIVKNSWGSGEEEFPNKGEGNWGILNEETGKHTGYFYLSYYDQSIATPEALDFEANSESDESYTDVIDQHDLLPIKDYLAAQVDSEVRTANVFKASVCEELKKVSCETVYPNTEVTFEVYLLAESFDSPTDGLLMDTVTESFEYGGFHKVALKHPFTVMRGQSYAIVVSQKVPVSGGTSYAVGVKMGLGNAVVNKGESLLLADGEWQDLSDKALQQKLADSTEGKNGADIVDNFPIKGYAEERPDVVLEVKFSGYLILQDEDSDEQPEAYFKAWFTDNTGSGDPISVVPEWKIADGGDGVIEMTDGRDPSRKTITCKKLGRDYLVITAEGIGQVVHSIKVLPQGLKIKSIRTGKDSVTLNVETIPQEGFSGIEVQYREKGTKTWKKKDFAPAASTLVLTGLKKGKRYEIKAGCFAESNYGRLFSYMEEKLSDTVGLKNTMNASGKTLKVKYLSLKKKAASIAGKKAVSVSKAKGKVTYSKVSVTGKKYAKKFTVNKKTGKLTIKKGLKKGTYKVRIKVSAAGKGYYLPVAKTVTVKVKVK